MKKLALINAGRKIEFATTEPLNLECIAAYVKQFNIDVRIIDELAGQNVRRGVLKFNPDYVGVTGITPLVSDTYRISDMCRSMGFRTVIGGVHATILPEEALQHADIVVKGEGETAIVDIIQQDIKLGIIEGKPLQNLDDIPISDRSLVEIDFYLRMPETYLACVGHGVRAGTMLTSRGCSANCTFCHNSWRGLKYRCNSAKRVVEEMQFLENKYHVKVVYFIDDNFFMNRPRLHEICYQLIESKSKLTWAATSRVDNIDIESMKLAYQAGCRLLFFGFESGSQRILDSLNKKTTVEQNVKAIKMCHEVGILATGAFMIGSPTETIEDVRLTQEFIKKNPVDSASAWITTPFPATQIWEWGREHGLIQEHPDWSKFIFTGINSGVLACDTISIPQLELLFKETNALLNNTHNTVTPRWFISMALCHPLKSIVIALRSSASWSKYLYKIKVN